MRFLSRKQISGVWLLILLQVALEVNSLHFRLPKEGKHYDTSEAVFLFEREADEDGYPILEVDGVVIRQFDFKQMDYEVSLMGQQVGHHMATVRLMEYSPEEVAEGATNSVLHNATVHYFIATPGTVDMRQSLLASLEPDAEVHQRGLDYLQEAMTHISNGGEEMSAAQEAIKRAIDIDNELGYRKFKGAVLGVVQKYVEAGGELPGLFATEAENLEHKGTADVLSSEGGVEMCQDYYQHELAYLSERIHPTNPYLDFDGSGLSYTAGEHQGHDQSMMAILIHMTQPKLIIEVGSWKGGSAIQMASVVRARGWGCRTKILCVDTWLGTSTDLKSQRLPLKNGYPNVYREFMHNIIQAGCSSVVVPIPAPANIGSKMLTYLQDREEMPTADLIFIDGNHDYDDVRADIRNYFPLLSPRGVMFGDDFGWAGVKKAVYEFAEEHNLTVYSPGGRTWLMY